VKTLKVSDEVHRKLTAALRALMSETGRMQTYQDALEATQVSYLAGAARARLKPPVCLESGDKTANQAAQLTIKNITASTPTKKLTVSAINTNAANMENKAM